jgi:broad specificity phosphatase PhoE
MTEEHHIEESQTQNKELNFYFHRHGLSCNNIEKNLLRKQSDPGLADFGIITAIEVGKRLRDEKKIGHPKQVYVSCMIRTWLTAVSMHGALFEEEKETETEPLTLVVSPFLKEFHYHPADWGNLPEAYSEQKKRFQELFKQMKADYHSYGWRNVVIKVFGMDDDTSFRYTPEYSNYFPDGIVRFCGHYKKLNPENLEPVFAVAHSNIMKACCKTLDPLGFAILSQKKSKFQKAVQYVTRMEGPEEEQLYDWFNQNLWTLHLKMTESILPQKVRLRIEEIAEIRRQKLEPEQGYMTNNISVVEYLEGEKDNKDGRKNDHNTQCKPRPRQSVLSNLTRQSVPSNVEAVYKFKTSPIPPTVNNSLFGRFTRGLRKPWGGTRRSRQNKRSRRRR